MLRNLQLHVLAPGHGTLTASHLHQSIVLGQIRTRPTSKTVSTGSELSRAIFAVRHGPIVRKVQYQGRIPRMASEYSTRLEAVQHPRPHTPSPATGTARSELAKTQLRNYSSKMVSQSVNKTALHPGGVEYVAVVLCLALSLTV
jgi:hypothetical protein